MAKAVSSVAADINEVLRKNGNECVTLKWDQLYKLCARQRISEGVMEDLENQLKKLDLHIIYGNNVIVVRDFCWRPVTL